MPLRAVEYVRRMRGGAQAHLLRGEDGGYWVVKFQNNPQHIRILANELLGSRLAARLGLPVPRAEVIEVDDWLIAHTPELVIQLGNRRVRCQSGFQFGSRYPGEPGQVMVQDVLTDERMREVENLTAFLGVLVFDKWTCNCNGRQVIFWMNGQGRSYRLEMIDQGFCFNAGEWSFPDSPLRGLYPRLRVYEAVRGMESFEPLLSRVENFNASDLDRISAEVPPEWYEHDHDGFDRLLEQLYTRRVRVRDLLRAARNSDRQPFPNWMETHP